MINYTETLSNALNAVRTGVREEFATLATRLAALEGITTEAEARDANRRTDLDRAEKALGEEAVNVLRFATSTWSGGALSTNNLIEAIRAEVARDVLQDARAFIKGAVTEAEAVRVAQAEVDRQRAEEEARAEALRAEFEGVECDVSDLGEPVAITGEGVRDLATEARDWVASRGGVEDLEEGDLAALAFLDAPLSEEVDKIIQDAKEEAEFRAVDARLLGYAR